MTEQPSRSTRESRRSFIKKGALTSGGLSVGVGSVDVVAAQQTGEGEESDLRSGVMFNHEYHPGAQIRVTSPAIQELPDLDVADEQNPLDGHHLRIVEYVNTSEQAQLFLPSDVEVQQGSVYELARITQVFESSPAKGLVSIQFGPVEQGDALFDDDGTPSLEPGQDFDVIDGGGTVLISGYRFYFGALFRVDSAVIDWTPREKIQQVDTSAEYNTRLAEYLGTAMNFVFYPSNDATIERGAVYVMREDSDIAEVRGRFLSVEVNRVDEESLDEDLLQS